MGFEANRQYRLVDRAGFLEYKSGNEALLKKIDGNFGILEPTIVVFGVVVQAKFKKSQFCYLEPAEIKFFIKNYHLATEQTLGLLHGCRNFI